MIIKTIAPALVLMTGMIFPFAAHASNTGNTYYLEAAPASTAVSSVIGKWKYGGISVGFKTEEQMQKAGGKKAVAEIEKKLDAEMRRLGANPAGSEIDFRKDGTFIASNGKEGFSGKYNHDKEKGNVSFTLMNYVPVKTSVSGTPSKITLSMDTRNIIAIAAFAGNHPDFEALKPLIALLGTYEGMTIGVNLKK